MGPGIGLRPLARARRGFIPLPAYITVPNSTKAFSEQVQSSTLMSASYGN